MPNLAVAPDLVQVTSKTSKPTMTDNWMCSTFILQMKQSEIIGHVNIGIIPLCMENSQGWLYETQSKSDWLSNTTINPYRGWNNLQDGSEFLITERILFGVTRLWHRHLIIIIIAVCWYNNDCIHFGLIKYIQPSLLLAFFCQFALSISSFFISLFTVSLNRNLGLPWFCLPSFSWE